MASYDAGNPRDIELVQRLSSLPRLIPQGYSIQKAKIPSDPQVISFFKDKFLGPKLSTQADTIVVLKAEWVQAERIQKPDKVVLLLHGGAYAVGSPQMYRWLTCPLSSSCNAKVLGGSFLLRSESLILH
jgi:acetyl esterase/lipase